MTVLAFKIFVYIFYSESLLPKLSHIPTCAQKYVIRMFNTVVFIRETSGL